MHRPNDITLDTGNTAGNSVRDAIAVTNKSIAIPDMNEGASYPSDATARTPKRIAISIDGDGTTDVYISITVGAQTTTVAAGFHLFRDAGIVFFNCRGQTFINHIGSAAAGSINITPLEE